MNRKMLNSSLDVHKLIIDDKDKLHLPHVHYFISDFKNKKWNEKLFTERIICDVNKQQLTEMIKNKCAVINALPYQEYMKSEYQTLYLFHTIL